MLNGIRILEVEGLGPGPFAAMTLADLGADVIVVHRKQTNPDGIPDSTIVDRGKRSIALDLKAEDDVATFKRLVASCDGLIEGFRPGVMERLGLGPDTCLQINPSLVYGRMTGWGQTGPLAQTAGHDLNYIALSGALWYASLPDQPPVTPPTLIGDIGGGALYLVIGMLAGIMNARRSGKGTVVDAAMIDGSAHMMNLIMTMQQVGQFETTRGESMLDGSHWSRTYRTSDGGYISVQCLEAKFYRLFLERLGLQDDEQFQQQYQRELWPVLTERLSRIFLTRTRDEWADLFEGTDACVAPVLSPEESAHQSHISERKVWQQADGVLQAAPAPRFSSGPEWQPSRPPARNQHEEDILSELDAFGISR